MYKIVNLGRRLFEDEGPEVWDLGNEFGALLVERSMEGFGFANCTVSAV